MDPFDQVRLLEEDLGGPQRVREVAAVPLQFGGERAVHRQVLAGGEQAGQAIAAGHRMTSGMSVLEPGGGSAPGRGAGAAAGETAAAGAYADRIRWRGAIR
ncbi:hypothetical protein GCM10022377_21160 [Zhihengliuella alba]|uniref:Uncharacterized protein n=1 Tax=Zhihengliuella alba TaxID=547018 RepID=A0ABP7DNA5_9MICC